MSDHLDGGEKIKSCKYLIRISSAGLNLVLSASLARMLSRLIKKTLNSIDSGICSEGCYWWHKLYMVLLITSLGFLTEVSYAVFIGLGW